MTNKMKAIVLVAPGGPEALQARRVDMPWPAADDDVLVRLKVAALNPADAYFRSFGPYVDQGGPCVLGHDAAGSVEQVGKGVTRVRPGQRVCFCNGGIGGHFGTYAEFAVVPETQLSLIPDSVDDTAAAALPLVFITAWESLQERAGVKAGDFVLIHAGAGGTGHVGVQLAVELGGRVATTVSSDEKIALVQKLGAERAIAYRGEDFVEVAREWSAEHGIDVALDNLGPQIFQKTIAAMAPYGNLVTLMGMPADDTEDTAYVNNLTIHNVMMLTPMLLGLQQRLDHQATIVARGLQLLEQGKLQLHIDSRYDFDDIAAAHERLDAGNTTGKIVIDVAR
jgi:NADPH2:quinone reductase